MAAFVGVQGGAESYEKEFPPTAVGVSRCEEVVLGATFMWQGYWMASSSSVTEEVEEIY